MALTWNIAGMEKHLGKEGAHKFTTSPFSREDGGTGEQWHPVTEAIVWRLMAVGMSSITLENLEKVYIRVRTYEHLADTAMAFERNGKLCRCPITRQDIINHIGLSTNVSTLTDAQFKQKIYDMAVRAAHLGNDQKSAHDVCQDQLEYVLAKQKAD
jgi:hypothetical protein